MAAVSAGAVIVHPRDGVLLVIALRDRETALTVTIRARRTKRRRSDLNIAASDLPAIPRLGNTPFAECAKVKAWKLAKLPSPAGTAAPSVVQRVRTAALEESRTRQKEAAQDAIRDHAKAGVRNIAPER